MCTENMVSEQLSRVAHRFGKGAKWIERERPEWERCRPLMDAEDSDLEKAVSAFIAGKETYHLDGLLAKLGKKRHAKPAGDGCAVCISGFVELAVWRGPDVSAFNPEITAIRCRCSRGGLVKDAMRALRGKDEAITDIFPAVEIVDGQIQRKTLNEEETGVAPRRRLRAAGIPWPGSPGYLVPSDAAPRQAETWEDLERRVQA